MLAKPFRLLAALCVIVGVMAVVAVSGCGVDTRRVGNAGRTGRMASSGERSQSLLQTAAAQLSELPEQSIVELRPPSVILDSSRSINGENIEAQLVARPSQSGQPLFVLNVPAGNANLDAVGVKPGDLVKWYANLQSELDTEFSGKKNRLSPLDILSFFKLPVTQQQQIASARARQGDPQLEDMLRLPDDKRSEVLKAMELESLESGDIISEKAFEMPVAQVIDSNTLMPVLSELTADEQRKLPLEVPFRLEIIRYRDTLFSELDTSLRRYSFRGVPRLGWEPSPDHQAIEQIVERLNQWLRQAKTDSDWQPPKLMETLNPRLRENKKLQLLISSDALARDAFSQPTETLRATQSQEYEGRLLQEATWARDIANWVTADQFEPLSQANRLFDWTVRNLALENPASALLPYRPWQSLAYGHATAEGRAWVFAQLCRHQEIPVVVLRPAGDEGPVWCGAMISGNIYLYDPELGLNLQDSTGETATLQSVLGNPQSLSEFDTDDKAYLSEQANLESFTAQVVAGPFALSRRVALLEQRLTGANAMFPSVDVDQLAETLEGIEGVDEVRLWDYPYQVLLDQLEATRNMRTRTAWEFEPFVHKPRLWKARLLTFRGARGQSVDTNRGNLESEVDDHRDAGRLYTHESVRPPQKVLEALKGEAVIRAWTNTKQNATYWQGLLSYDRGHFKTASQWLTQADSSPKWRQAARYNRARALESLGETTAAIEMLNATEGPQAHGNRIRAKRLAAEQSQVTEE